MSFADSVHALVRDATAVWGFLTAAGLVLVLTPLVARLAPSIGGVDDKADRPRVHGGRPIPRIGGLAIVIGIAVPMAIFIKPEGRSLGILLGTLMVAGLGLIDDIKGINASVKMVGIVVAALIPVVAFGMTWKTVGLPLIGNFDLGWVAYPLTIFWIAALAKLFMGDTGALALGFLLACVAVQGVLKTAATIALAGPLLVLAVPILDTSFVVLKRLKYGRAPWNPDHNHFYHRFMRIGFSQRRTAAYLHVWALLLAAYAILLRFVPPRPRGNWDLGNALIATGVGLVVLAASVWMVYTLEILKSRHLRLLRLGGAPEEPEREEAVERALSAGRR